MKIALSGSVLLTFLLYQFASARGSRTAAAIWRMATILATVALAVSGLQRHPQPSGAGLIAAGLAVSVFGDLFFVLPRERFVPGFCFAAAVAWAA